MAQVFPSSFLFTILTWLKLPLPAMPNPIKSWIDINFIIGTVPQMLRDSPFHTSATLLQKVRESINNRQPPSKPVEERIPHPPQKRYQYVPQNIVRQSKNPLFSRPSLQYISRGSESEPMVSYQSCKEIEGPLGQYYFEGGGEKNPFQEPLFKRGSDRKYSIEDEQGRKEVEVNYNPRREEYQRMEIRKSSGNNQRQEDTMFKYQDFQDQLNEMLRDQSNARELLNLIERKGEDPLESMIKADEKIDRMVSSDVQRMYVNMESEMEERLEEEIDFDALREEELAVVYPNKGDLMGSRLPVSVMGEFGGKMEIGGQKGGGERRMFLFFEGEVEMSRYGLSG